MSGKKARWIGSSAVSDKITMEEFRSVALANLKSIQNMAASSVGSDVFLGREKEIEELTKQILEGIKHEPR